MTGGGVALAEMARERGCLVAIVSSTMNAEFVSDGGSIPAFYFGYSLGAFHGFHVAAAERAPESKLVRFDVDFYAVPAVPADQPLPFTNAEAEYLVGFAFQRSLKAVLYASQERDDLGILLTERRPLRRNPPYEEIGDYSFAMYFYGFVLPYHRDRLGSVATPGEMVEANDLRAIADGLRDNPKLHVFANENDFLTTDDDLAWLGATVGDERVRIFPTGGHLGNLHRPEVQAEILAPLTAR